jgi:hypothetical protein
MLHTCAPPHQLLSRWLTSTANSNVSYSHYLFEQVVASDGELVSGLRPYFESAHQDAREVFHASARIDLHPDADAPGSHAQYPNCLPMKARRGLFGEVMAGLFVEAYQVIGAHHWTIPIYLFRYHAEVEAYIFDLARDPARTREVSGRHGNDFIALGLDPNSGAVVRFLAGEAKWRAGLTPSVMDELMHGEYTGPTEARVRDGFGVWNEMNTGLANPQGLEQMSRLLKEKARDQYAEAIVSLDQALLLDAHPLPRIDYVFVAGNRAKRRGQGVAYLPVISPPSEYTAGRNLQVIELVLSDGEALIDSLYTTLWGGQ